MDNYWKILNAYNSSFWRCQCPKCKKIFEMPRAWGSPWKGCPICWIELKFDKSAKVK